MRCISTILIFCLLFQTTLPLWATENVAEVTDAPKYQFFGKMLKRLSRDFKVKADDITPEAMQQIIDQSVNKTFEGNPTLRQEKSSILRPIKQVTLEVMDGEIGIVQSFISFQVARFLKKYPSDPNVQLKLAKAGQAVQLLSSKQLDSVQKALSKLKISSKVKAALNNHSPAVKGLMKTEANFVLMSIIGMFIWMGIYDGLDVYAVKDRILNLDPLWGNHMWSGALIPTHMSSVASRHLYGFFNGRFDSFYDKMMDSKSFGGRILKIFDKRADLLGRKIFKATRKGLEIRKGESLATKLGLVGVGEGSQFTLRGLLKSVSVGIAFGLAANLAVNTVEVGLMGYHDSAIIGANRDRKIVRPEYNGYLFQRENTEIGNWLKERKFAVMDLLDQYTKTPLTKVVSTVTGFSGAYLGSVVAGAMLLGGTMPAMVGGVMIASVFGGLGSFLGDWATTKFERGDWMKDVRRGLVERRLYKVILKMDYFKDQNMDSSKARELARLRSLDMKKMEDMGQVYVQIRLVDSFNNIELYDKGQFQFMRVKSNHGEEIDTEAHNRYAFVDIKGHRGAWDFGTRQIFDVGNIQQNNGYSVIFVSENENISVQKGLISNAKGSDIRVLSNGVIMTKSELNKERWAIRGININTDVFLRESKIRYTWDYDLNAFRQVNDLTNRESELFPLLSVFSGSDKNDRREKLNKMVGTMVKSTHDAAMQKLANVSEENEAEFLAVLQQQGLSEESLQRLKGMDLTEWKNIVRARIERGYHSRLKQILNQFDQLSPENLQDALLREIDNPANETCYDALRKNLNQNALISSYSH